MKEIYPKFFPPIQELMITGMTKFSSHYAVLSLTEQKIHPVENCYYHKHCENTKNYEKRSKHQHKKEK